MKTLCLIGVLAGHAVAQSLVEPPPLVHLIRRLGPDTSAARRYADAGAALNVFGMTAITGLPETWLVEAHGSFGSIEDVNKAMPLPAAIPPPDQQADEVLSPARSVIGLYRPIWSYRPDQAIRMFAKARYFYVSIYRVRPGGEAEFADLVKSRRVLFDAMNVDRPDLAYQVISGAPSGTYFFLAPLTSLRVLDEVLPRALAGEGRAATKNEGEVGRENLLLRVDPAISYVADDVAEADPEFWRGKSKSQ